jgi:hypothetical protein
MLYRVHISMHVHSRLFSGLSLFIMWNPLTNPECVLVMLQHRCEWEMPSWLLSYKVQLFSLTELPFEGMCCPIFQRTVPSSYASS